VAGFILANGALSGAGEEYKIRRKLIENNLVEAIIVLPRDTFYTTDISVTLWIINKNKKSRTIEINGRVKNYRDRDEEILFMDLRRWGTEYDKQFIEILPEDITRIAENYHNWQQQAFQDNYKNIPEYCYSANFNEIKANDFSLIPSKYIPFMDKDADLEFDVEMKRIQTIFKKILRDEKESQVELTKAFKDLGYEL
jgi:type I restriction enzyme M protein